MPILHIFKLIKSLSNWGSKSIWCNFNRLCRWGLGKKYLLW